jgi:hypothetical protein
VSIILSLFIIIGPIAIIYCGVKALQHTIIIRNAKRRESVPPWLINSVMNVNGPLRRFNVK